MSEPEAPEQPEAVTAWHPMLVALLEIFLPAGWQLIPELLLSRLPQRVDILILELVGAVPGEAHRLHSIFDHLRPHTLIEHKGPTDDLAAEDALVLLGYGAQYMRLKKVKSPAEVCLMVVADRITPGFVEQIARHDGRFAQVGQGLWKGEAAGFALHGVETYDASRSGSSERLLYAFSRAFITNPRGGPPLDEEARRVYTLLKAQVEQFRKARGPAAMKYDEMMQKSLEELMEPVLETFSPEQRLRGLTPEQRLQGLTPEQRLQGLTPEQLREQLTPEQLREGLTPEQRLQGLTPEQLAATIDALPAEVREQLKGRLH
jgi:hypothetical protein